MVPDVGIWSAPCVMAALAGVVHNREGASGPEHNYGQDNQQWVLHGDLASAGPRLPSPNYRGSNEPNVNAPGTVCCNAVCLIDRPGPREAARHYSLVSIIAARRYLDVIVTYASTVLNYCFRLVGGGRCGDKVSPLALMGRRLNCPPASFRPWSPHSTEYGPSGRGGKAKSGLSAVA
jgi:hypothetical protein